MDRVRNIIFWIIISFICLFPLNYVNASSVKTIGVVYSADIPHYSLIHHSVIENLQSMGVDINSIRFIEQRPYPDVISWANSVRKLIAYDADLIITYGSGATYEALNETGTVPVVYGAVFGKPPEITGKKNCCGSTFC